MKAVRTIIFLIALAVFLGSGAYIGHYYYTSIQQSNEFAELKTENGHDLVALHKKNPDIVGWITVPGTRIDYPVMQTPDEPEYYLRRNFNKEDSVAGTPFMDAASKIGKSKNYLIYGHNIKAGTMFHQLLKFEEEDFWKEHKTFTYDELKNGKQVSGTYEVVCFFRSEISAEDADVFKYYEYADIEDQDDFFEYVSGIKALAPFDTGVNPSWPDQLVTLSTCAYHTDNGRFAMVGRKIK